MEDLQSRYKMTKEELGYVQKKMIQITSGNQEKTSSIKVQKQPSSSNSSKDSGASNKRSNKIIDVAQIKAFLPEKEEVEMADRKPTLGISRSQHFERGGFANMLEAPKESSPQDPDFAFERNDNEPEDSFRFVIKARDLLRGRVLHVRGTVPVCHTQ